MKKSKKISIIIALCFMLAGLLICAGTFIAADFNLERYDSSVYTTKEYTFNDEIKTVNINCDTASINILQGNSNTCTITCYEDEKSPHTVTLKEGTLTIKRAEKHWYDYIKLFSFRSPEITLYLPQEMYTSISVQTATGQIHTESLSATCLELETSTGYITVENTEYADSIDAEVSTGKITIKNTTCGNLSAEASTGRISLENVKAVDIECENSTGSINITKTTAENNISAETSTGDIIFETSDGRSIFAETSTGDIKGTILTEKTFDANTDTGYVSVPDTQGIGIFKASASTGDINISYATE